MTNSARVKLEGNIYTNKIKLNQRGYSKLIVNKLLTEDKLRGAQAKYRRSTRATSLSQVDKATAQVIQIYIQHLTNLTRVLYHSSSFTEYSERFDRHNGVIQINGKRTKRPTITTRKRSQSTRKPSPKLH